MNITTLHHAYACSCLVIGNMGEIKLTGEKSGTSYKTMKTFVKTLLKDVRRNQHLYEKNLTDHTFEEFAHIVASTSHNQPMVEEYLSELGFTPSERINQKKNKNQKIVLWNMPVPKFLEKLEEMKDIFGIEEKDIMVRYSNDVDD